jgi:hypothetical protein
LKYEEKWDESELDESDKALIKLKYILYKNLADISTKYTKNLPKALNFLIQVSLKDLLFSRSFVLIEFLARPPK